MINRFFNTTISFSRMTWVGDSSGLVAQGNFSGHVQQTQPELVEHLGEVLGRTFTIWCDEDAGVQIGDRLTIASGDYAGTFTVKNVQIQAPGAGRIGRERNSHLELVVIRDDF